MACEAGAYGWRANSKVGKRAGGGGGGGGVKNVGGGGGGGWGGGGGGLDLSTNVQGCRPGVVGISCQTL